MSADEHRRSDAAEVEMLGHFEDIRRNGKGWIARCPTHVDANPSLSIAHYGDRWLLYCHAGCSTESVLERAGLAWSDLQPGHAECRSGSDPPDYTPKDSDEHRPILDTYRYHDERGELSYSVGRTAEKDFPIWHPDARGGYRWGLSGVPRILYRLPEMMRAVESGSTVYLAEGEKDADTLRAAGVTATCNLGGAGKWRDEDSVYLRGAQVVIVAHKDEPGRRHAASIAASLRPLAASVRVVEAAEGNDAFDHLAAGMGLEDFVTVASSPGTGATLVSENESPGDNNARHGGSALNEVAGQPQTHKTGKGATPSRARRLNDWSNTLGLEKNCAQHLILGPNGHATWRHRVPHHDVEKTVGTMQSKPVTATNGFLGLSADAVATLPFLHTQYVRQDMPESGWVEFSPEDLLRAIGRSTRRANCTVAGILDELLSGTFFGLLSLHSGQPVRGTLKAIEWYIMRASGRCEVGLPEVVAENLRNDFTAYLDHDTLLELKRADPLAMRLWIYAEAQNLKRSRFAKNGLPMCIFRQPYTDKNKTLTVSEMLSLTRGSETKGRERIHAAVDCVNNIDAKYEMHVEMRTSWRLVLKRGDLK